MESTQSHNNQQFQYECIFVNCEFCSKELQKLTNHVKNQHLSNIKQDLFSLFTIKDDLENSRINDQQRYSIVNGTQLSGIKQRNKLSFDSANEIFGNIKKRLKNHKLDRFLMFIDMTPCLGELVYLVALYQNIPCVAYESFLPLHQNVIKLYGEIQDIFKEDQEIMQRLNKIHFYHTSIDKIKSIKFTYYATHIFIGEFKIQKEACDKTFNISQNQEIMTVYSCSCNSKKSRNLQQIHRKEIIQNVPCDSFDEQNIDNEFKCLPLTQLHFYAQQNQNELNQRLTIVIDKISFNMIVENNGQLCQDELLNKILFVVYGKQSLLDLKQTKIKDQSICYIDTIVDKVGDKRLFQSYSYEINNKRIKLSGQNFNCGSSCKSLQNCNFSLNDSSFKINQENFTLQKQVKDYDTSVYNISQENVFQSNKCLQMQPLPTNTQMDDVFSDQYYRGKLVLNGQNSKYQIVKFSKNLKVRLRGYNKDELIKVIQKFSRHQILFHSNCVKQDKYTNEDQVMNECTSQYPLEKQYDNSCKQNLQSQYIVSTFNNPEVNNQINQNKETQTLVVCNSLKKLKQIDIVEKFTKTPTQLEQNLQFNHLDNFQISQNQKFIQLQRTGQHQQSHQENSRIKKMNFSQRQKLNEEYKLYHQLKLQVNKCVQDLVNDSFPLIESIRNQEVVFIKPQNFVSKENQQYIQDQIFQQQTLSQTFQKPLNQQMYYDQNSDYSEDLPFSNLSQITKSPLKEQNVFSQMIGNKLYCISFEPQDIKYNYPFLDTNKYIGIIQKEELNDINYSYVLQQEQKQKMKNDYYLWNLQKLNLVDDIKRMTKTQLQDELYFTKKAFEIDLNSISQLPDEINNIKVIDLLQMFHTYLFFLLYNGQYQFYKRLLTNKFTFSRQFYNIFELINNDKRKTLSNETFMECVLDISSTKLKEVILEIKGNKYYDEKLKMTIDNVPQIQTTVVPIKVVSDKAGNQVRKIDFQIIEDTYRYINSEILKFVFSNYEQKEIFDNFSSYQDLDNFVQKSEQHIEQNNLCPYYDINDKVHKKQKLKNYHNFVQSCEVNQNLYQVLEINQISDDQFFKQIKQVSSQTNRQFLFGSEKNLLNFPITNLSVQKYFVKTGLYLNQKENQIFYKCSKHRHFLDFSQQKIKKFQNSYLADISQYKLQQNVTQVSLKEQQNQLCTTQFKLLERVKKIKDIHVYIEKNVIDNDEKVQKYRSIINSYLYQDYEKVYEQNPQKINTNFDLLQQYSSMTPYSQEQFMVFQTACFHIAQLNEIKLIRKFISNFYDIEIIKNDYFEECKENSQKILDLNQQKIMCDNMKDCKKASDYFLQHPKLVIEALTPPAANRKLIRLIIYILGIVDYERLEFYGDSVINFLVVLELFLCYNKNWTEGELDFNRIQKVSNMNFTKINQKVKLYEYMLFEQILYLYLQFRSSKIFNDYVPVGFDDFDYRNNVKQKNLNEISAQILYLKQDIFGIVKFFLRKQSFFLEIQKHKNSNQFLNEYVTDEYIITMKLFLTQEDLKKSLYSHQNGKAIQIYLEEKKTYGKKLLLNESIFNSNFYYKIGQRWIDECFLGLFQLKQMVIQQNIKKYQNKLSLESSKVCQLKNQKIEKLQIQSKSLADVVESVTGVLAFKCGLVATIDFLREKLKLLNFTVYTYDQSLNELQSESTLIYHVDDYMDKINKIQQILQYKFKNSQILLQALTHKSTKEQIQKNSHQYQRQNDYERLEFLGDSILNFLVTQHFFLTTQNKSNEFQPKQLHKLKTSVVNNVILSLVVIENNIHKCIIYNKQSENFQKQFDTYVQTVKSKVDIIPTSYVVLLKKLRDLNSDVQQIKQLLEKNRDIMPMIYAQISKTNFDKQHQVSSQIVNQNSSKYEKALKLEGNQLFCSNEQKIEIQNIKDSTLIQFQCLNLNDYLINLDTLYEYSLKIFGDVFESLIGAVFVDSKSLQKTSEILFNLLQPYIDVYADINYVQDHKRTTLFELWYSKSYAKRVKICHQTQPSEGDMVFLGMIQNKYIFKRTFKKDEKSKTRTFYKEFFEFIKDFIKSFEAQYQKVEDQTEENFMHFLTQFI